MPYDLIVIGSGLVGGAATRLSAARGLKTLCIDRREAGAASPCAAGVWRPSWFSKQQRALEQAEEVFSALGLRPVEIPFLRKEKEGEYLEMQFVHPDSLRVDPDLEGSVLSVERGAVTVESQNGEGTLKIEGKEIYVAAGVWADELLPEINLAPKTGTVYWYSSEENNEYSSPLTWSWAPYKQAFRFERRPDSAGIYFSDGTAVLRKNYKPSHEEATRARARQCGLELPLFSRTGHRPYLAGKEQQRRFGRTSAGIWYGTGTAKSGTILGPAFALQLLQEIAPIA